MFNIINKNFINKFCITSAILLTGVFAFEGYSAEATGANIVGNIVDAVTTANQSQKQAVAEPSATEKINSVADQSALPKLEDILKTNTASTETSESIDSATDMVKSNNQDEKTSAAASPSSTLITQNQAPSSTAAIQQQKYFVTAQGTVFTPPEGIPFPPEMIDGWYYVTNDINRIKDKIDSEPKDNPSNEAVQNANQPQTPGAVPGQPNANPPQNPGAVPGQPNANPPQNPGIVPGQPNANPTQTPGIVSGQPNANPTQTPGIVPGQPNANPTQTPEAVSGQPNANQPQSSNFDSALDSKKPIMFQCYLT